VVWKRFQGRFEYHPGVHQNPPPDVTGRDVVIVDFSYKRPVLDAMAQTAKSITILDHHKSAQEDLAAFTVSLCGSARFVHEDLAGVWRDMEELGRPKIVAEFDMARSGAQMTWDFFCPDLSQRPALVDYVGDRDLWKFNLPCSREVNAFVFAHEYTFENWDHLDRQLRDHMDVQRVADMGAAIEKKHHKDVAELVANNRRKMVIGGHVAPVANIPYTLASDAGHLLCEPIDEGLHGLWVPPFGVCYWDTPEGRVFSLRSTDAGLDVSEVAKGYGGGGHRNASGFRMPIGWEGDNG
jgi:oligoribonuclease NrnB/cAMP/cGMP phosphodiesterase (DHH superfamily)